MLDSAVSQPKFKSYYLKSGAFVEGNIAPRYLSCDERTDMDALLKELKEIPDLRQITEVVMRVRFALSDENIRVLVTDDHLHVLADSFQLTALRIKRGIITDKSLKLIAKQKRLERLDLGDNEIGDEGLEELLSLENLESLRLDGTKVTNAGLKDISKLKSLTVLKIGPLITEHGLKEIAKHPTLGGLYLPGNKITADGLKALALAPKLAGLALLRIRELLRIRPGCYAFIEGERESCCKTLHAAGQRDKARRSLGCYG